MMAEIKRAWSEVKDFTDLMLHPGRRIAARDATEQKIEDNFQNNVAGNTNMWSGALSGEHDWGKRPW